MAIYYAHIDRVPVLVLGATGPLDRSKRRQYIDWITARSCRGNAVRDYVKWDEQPASAADFGPSFARGYRIATHEPGGSGVPLLRRGSAPFATATSSSLQRASPESATSVPSIFTRSLCRLRSAPRADRPARVRARLTMAISPLRLGAVYDSVRSYLPGV